MTKPPMPTMKEVARRSGVAGDETDKTFAYATSSTRFLANASLGYQQKIVERKVILKLNVSNVFDDDNAVFPACRGASNGTVYPHTYYYHEPRKFTLTATIVL